MRDYRFLIAFEEAGIWEELALASDGSLPRVDRSIDQPLCYSLALTPKVADALQIRSGKLRSGIHLIALVGTPELFL